MTRTVARVLTGILLAAGMATWAPSFARADADGFGGVEMVALEELEATRGGYKAGTDLMLSFGIEKAVYVNGVLEATNSLNLLQPGRERSQGSQGKDFNLRQYGDKNFSAFTAKGQGFQGTIIQNSENNKWIQTFTKISAECKILGVYRENNLSATLNHQLTRSIR